MPKRQRTAMHNQTADAFKPVIARLHPVQISA